MGDSSGGGALAAVALGVLFLVMGGLLFIVRRLGDAEKGAATGAGRAEAGHGQGDGADEDAGGGRGR